MGERGPKKGEGGRPRKKAGTKRPDGYVQVTTGSKANPKREYKHRAVKGLKKGDKRVVDHKDRNRSNNAKSNLRVTTQGENLRNRRKG